MSKTRNILVMSNGYPNPFPDVREGFSSRLVGRVKKGKFQGLDYQEDGSHSLCAVYAIMSFLGVDNGLIRGEYEKNIKKALKWVLSIKILSINETKLVNKIMKNSELFDYWYDKTTTNKPQYDKDMVDIQRLLNNLTHYLCEHFKIPLHLIHNEYPLGYNVPNERPKNSRDLGRDPTIDDIALAVIFNGNLNKMAARLNTKDFLLQEASKFREVDEDKHDNLIDDLQIGRAHV